MAAVLARLGSAVGFAEAAAVLHLALGVAASEATARRRTYAAGAAGLAVEEAELAHLERALPAPAAAPARLQLSIDATKVPLVGGAWTDVKLAVFADLVPGPPGEDGRPTTEAVNLTYAARWAPADQFARTRTLEAHRRGVDAAGEVVSPNDGAEWIRGGLDLVAPRAVRILDEPHAAEHLGTLGGLVHGEGTAAARDWVAAQRRCLLEEGPADVLAELARRRACGPHPAAPAGPDGLTPAEHLAREVAYCEKRATQLDYAAFRAAGYPIGSGIVERGHKVVVGRRCKGAGHHWAPAHLNPLLVLRTTACNDRWAPTWPALWAEQRRHTTAARRAAQRQRHAARLALAPPAPHPARAPAGRPAGPPAPPRPKRVVDGHPTDDHPWRRPFLPAPRRLVG